MIIRTEKDGETIVAMADTCSALARILGITPQAVIHGLHRKSRLYHYIDDEPDEDEE